MLLSNFARSCVLTSVCSFIVACVPASEHSSGRFGADSDGRSGGVTRGLGRATSGDNGVSPGALQRGTGQFINARSLSGQGRSRSIVVPADGERVELSLVNASVESAAQAVLADVLGLSYVVSDRVDGTITVQTTGPIPKQALFDLFEAALAANGTRIEKTGDVIQLVPGTVGSTAFRLAGGGSINPGTIIVAPLKYVSPSEMVNLLEPLTEDGLALIPDASRSLLLMSGPASALEAGLDALNLFDVDVMSGKSIALVRLRAAEPEAVVQELKTIFSNGEGESLDGLIEFVPNQRLGSILVITSSSDYLSRAQRWIRELDQSAAGEGRFLQTYRLQNRQAADIAPILNEMIASSDGQNLSIDGGSDRNVGAGLQVAADPARNALIVRATKDEHTEILHLLRDLDSAALQVMLEATIAEVTLNDELDVGVRWFFESGKAGLRFSDLAGGAVASTFPGFSGVISGGDSQLALSALATVTDVKVISSPTLLVVDNKQGVLQIGDQVPIATQTSSESVDNAAVLTQVEYRDTGIILTVSPRVGSGGRVSLDIEQEVSDVSSTQTSGIDSPTISTRRVQTSAVLSDGQTLALGGLVQESDNISRGQVPGLGDVPGLGALFRNRSGRKERTELLILIRPRVVYDANSASRLTQEWRNRFNGANSILSTGLGSPRHSIRDIAQ